MPPNGEETRTLPPDFFSRDPELVARDLLGKILVRRLDGRTLSGIIVETEAYYGVEDPASRARYGMKPYNRLMWGQPGLAFIYNVHNNWLLNIVAHEPGGVGAVLIRAIEPLEGVDLMMKHRMVGDPIKLTSGPGRLTKALRIDKSLNGTPVTSPRSEVFILDNELNLEVATSHRIGVREDLERDLRFFIRGNRFVSKAGRLRTP
ncbi:hypothetical protein DRO55_03265 [Candidatus Bathyarchaeota archaeon]|nr:MAG: hypothetical protein DRO55_03265 [Candidatus Bathyarchaeota archaeon]